MTVTRLEHDSFHWTRGDGGADDVRRVAETAAAHDHREALNEASRLELQHHGLDTSILLTATADGEDTVEGFALLHGLSGPGRPELELVVAPAHRGRGLGRTLAEAVLTAADGIPMTAWSHGNHPAAAALAPTLGFEAVRELWLMRRAAGEPLPLREAPAGATVRAYHGSEDDAGILAVNAAAFAHHPEQGDLDRAGLQERMAEPWFDPAGLVVGEMDGRVAGFHWTKVHPAGPGAAAAYGEVYVIGVDPSTQGSGLGRALLLTGLEHLYGLGLSEVVLYVEGDNDGAVRLYRSYGFTHAAEDTDVMYATAE